MKKIGRNEPCPCASGKKYKKCCWGKKFDWAEDEDGEVYKRIPLTPEMNALFERQRQRFIERYGREPEPHDPVFPDMPHPEHFEAHLVQMLKKAGVRPELVYATEKTGRVVTEDTYDLLTDAEQQEWEDAIDEYFERYPDGGYA